MRRLFTYILSLGGLVANFPFLLGDYKMANSSYYPHGGPAEFSYTEDFHQRFGETGQEAHNNLAARSFAFSSGFRNGDAAIMNLNAMIQIARASEQNFLIRHGFGSHATDNWSDLITGMNLIFSREGVFKRNVQIIQQVAEKKSNSYQDITGFFSSYVQSATREVFRQRGLNIIVDEQLMKEILQKAIKAMSKATDYIDENGRLKTTATKEEKETLESVRAFGEILGLINVFQNNTFFKEVSALLELESFVQDTQKAMLYNQENKKRSALPQIKTTMKGYAKGTIQEIVEATTVPLLLQGLPNVAGPGFTAAHTGGNLGKADVIISSTTGTVNWNDLNKNGNNEEKSVRVNMIDACNKLYQDMHDMEGEIVMISDKNYFINDKFKSRGGFEAQSNTTLENLEKLLDKVDAPFNVEYLIDYLANAGKDMIMGNPMDGVLRNIATQIGHFLFDDLSITEVPNKINIIHIFNLSGVYMPLSVYLEAAKEGIMATKADMEGFVKIGFHGDGTEAKTPWTRTVFEEFRLGRITKTTISIHFMKNFVDFIAQHIQL